jgi:soluble lytic murein transglycosylase-like protein
VHGFRQLLQVVTTGTVYAVMAGAQAAPSCPSASAEDLLGAAPAEGASGFMLAERLCGAVIVRSPSVPALAPAEETVTTPADAPAMVPQQQLTLRAEPRPALLAVPTTTTRKDAAGQARIRAVAPLVAEVAQRHDIDPLLLHALAHIESRHQSQAISAAGARGLMQVMPATGRDMGVMADRELLTPEANLEASARYLKRLQARFGSDLSLVLAAYNAGEGAVERYGRRVPPYAETQAYVRNVLAVYAELRRKLGGAA